MTDYQPHPEESYKGISRSPRTAAIWRIIDRAKGSVSKAPPYGTQRHTNWAMHLDHLLRELPSLQSLVAEYERVNNADN